MPRFRFRSAAARRAFVEALARDIEHANQENRIRYPGQRVRPDYGNIICRRLRRDRLWDRAYFGMTSRQENNLIQAAKDYARRYWGAEVI